VDSDSISKIQRGISNAESGRRLAPLFFVTLAVYILFSYGGIRSPDSEVAYRTAAGLLDRGAFAAEGYLAGYPRFGYAPGTDGKLYSRYQPLQPLVLAPFLWLGDVLTRCPLCRAAVPHVPGSHYAALDPGVMLGNPPARPGPHLRRMMPALSNTLFAALTVWLFAWVVWRLTDSLPAAWFSGGVFAFCTLHLTYAGTLFKEPLLGLLILGSFACLLARGPHRVAWTACSGLLAALGIATHLLAIPFLPFLGGLALALWWRRERSWSRLLKAGAAWGGAMAPVLLLLAWHNAARFGNVLDTGFRASQTELDADRFTAPWSGLAGLLVSPGKGLFLYCPIVLVSLFVWRRFHRRYPLLSWFTIATAGSRLLFVASFHDWHGGFCLGPRYLLNLLPFLLLPLGLWVADVARRPSRPRLLGLFVVTSLTLCQQIYFALGEVFSYLHWIKWETRGAIFVNNSLHFDPRLAPLLNLPKGNRGPFLLHDFPLGDALLFATLCLAGMLAAGLACYRLSRASTC